MLKGYGQSTMRTTLDIDEPILAELKRRGRNQHKPLGQVVSELVATALHTGETQAPAAPAFTWVAKPMRAKVDLADHDALLDAMDERPKP